MPSGTTQSTQKDLRKGVLRTLARRPGLPSCPPAELCLAFTPSTSGNYLLVKTACTLEGCTWLGPSAYTEVPLVEATTACPPATPGFTKLETNPRLH